MIPGFYGSDFHGDRRNSSMFRDGRPEYNELTYVGPARISSRGFTQKIVEQLQNKIKIEFYDRPSISGSTLSYFKINGYSFLCLDDVSYPYSRISCIHIGGLPVRP